MRSSAILALLSVLFAASPGVTQAREGRPSDVRSVATTRLFEFRSDPVLNLHDFLLWGVQSERPLEPRLECLARLDAAGRAAFERAREHYAATFAPPGPRQLTIALRFELAGFEDVNLVPDSVMLPAVTHLRAAMPAYERCWWEEHDRRNRQWIGELVPRLGAHEDTLAVRLARLYRAEWSGRIPVDVVGYAGWAGASTVANPNHIQVSSVNRGFRGDAAMEMVFHEASHTLFGTGVGAVWDALAEAAATPEAKRLTGELWHPILFYTAGKVVQARLAETGTPAYAPYLYSNGLFERGWGSYRVPLEQHWQAYLDGRSDLGDASARLLQAVIEAADAAPGGASPSSRED